MNIFALLKAALKCFKPVKQLSSKLVFESKNYEIEHQSQAFGIARINLENSVESAAVEKVFYGID